MDRLNNTLAFILIIILTTACNNKGDTAEKNDEKANAETRAAVNSVVALGRIEPEGEVIKLSVPNAQDSRVNNILVKEGNRVKKGQLIAVLQGLDRLTADVQDALTEVRLREAELTKVRQGEAKKAKIVAQNANIIKLQAQLRTQLAQKQAAMASAKAVLSNAESNYQRRSTLARAGAISRLDLDASFKELATARATLAERQADLEQTQTTLTAEISQAQAQRQELSEVRPVDISIAQAQLDKAKIAVKQRQASLQDVQVRAPIDGQVLRINTRVGEQVNITQGIMELAQTSQMLVAAEISEINIGKVSIGQTVRISSEYGGFSGELKGKVETISRQVGRRNLQEGNSGATGNPTNDQNARIVIVRIRIDPADSRKVEALTNMQVRVKIVTQTNASVIAPSGSARHTP